MKRLICLALIVSTTALGMPMTAHADTGVRSQVEAQLVARGVKAAEARARVAALTDDEAKEVAVRIEALPAGGNPAALSLMVGAALVIVALPFIIIVGLVVHAIKNGGDGGAVNTTEDLGPQ